MKKVLLLVIAALLIPGAALAAKPAPGSHPAPKVTYLLKGKLSAYTAYNAATSTNGSITILVSSSNYHAKALKGMSLTFAVGAHTKVTLGHGSVIKDGDKGVVTVRALQRIPAADLAATLQAAVPGHVIDQSK